VEAVAVAAGVRPIVVGKPEPPLFRMALERMALPPAAAAMVGDSVPSDIRGAKAVGMLTVLYAPAGRADAPGGRADAPEGGVPAEDADLVVGSFAELSSLAGVG
jgi:ribonucleotide monophosphatase NagD (HAD superfamily)